MISKFAKSPCPSKSLLKELYHSGLTQREIGKKYDVDYRTVLGWMKKLKIKSRGILHIVKNGAANPQWKGNKASYAAMHIRVYSQRGRPCKCENCGLDDPKRKYDWACIGDYKNVMDYKRLCRSCHFKMDKPHISRKLKRNRRKQFDSHF